MFTSSRTADSFSACSPRHRSCCRSRSFSMIFRCLAASASCRRAASTTCCWAAMRWASASALRCTASTYRRWAARNAMSSVPVRRLSRTSVETPLAASSIERNSACIFDSSVCATPSSRCRCSSSILRWRRTPSSWKTNLGILALHLAANDAPATASPGGASECSPRRQPWDFAQPSRQSAPQGRKKRSGTTLSPLRGC
ncbi:MAG: hypothetical protein AVDCRST_MAG64-263 [uncultured Phycisphaerae bacterium]|uniref:Uncharacterized protein n=1 Tax=uncultured Phycisphaerae bacterium TaxID=904963 RepID=A0A6J4N1N2_9BACT|nr:MAG: hypothetical protein AVDCRST_MAG64-263 [uncultured Phycisphaerae bacterium]